MYEVKEVMFMKKIIGVLLLIIGGLTLGACQSEKEVYSKSFYDYMDTFVSVQIYTDDEEFALDLFDDIEDVFALYHALTTGYEPLVETSTYKTNIYEINQTLNEKVEIDQALYEILIEAEEIKALTLGYFDVSVGKIVDVWKNIILDENAGYLFEEIPVSIYNQVIEALDDIDVVENPFTLEHENEKYYITINHEDVKIDLGAFSKGYATEKAHQILVDSGVEYYSVTAGSSSISLGKNSGRDTGLYHVSLANPVREGLDDRSYGMIKVQDLSVTTSGNYEQYALYNDLRFHHIISPITKLPMQYYHTVTILGQDAGFLDAVSTALFSMEPDVFETWLDTYKDVYQLEIIRFNYDLSITTFLNQTVFEEN
jgi:thiamine biosynthesis lipoprotein